jgi:hypothetical protein
MVAPKGDDNLTSYGVTLDINDTIWVLGQRMGAGIARFAPDGASTLFERKGNGPGEFQWIDFAVAHPAGDTVVIFNDSKVSFVSSQIREVRSFRNLFERARGFSVLRDGSVVQVVPHTSHPAAASGRSVHVTSATGDYIGSFDVADSLSNPGLWPMNLAHNSSDLWVVQPLTNGFTVQRWQVHNPRMISRVDVQLDWWVGETLSPLKREQLASKKATLPTLATGTNGVWDDGKVLWVVVRQFDEHHEQTDPDETTWWDAVLLAVDPETSEVLAARVFDQASMGFTNKGQLVLYETVDDHPSLKILEYELVR